jgi:hypothetical protein
VCPSSSPSASPSIEPQCITGGYATGGGSGSAPASAGTEEEPLSGDYNVVPSSPTPPSFDDGGGGFGRGGAGWGGEGIGGGAAPAHESHELTSTPTVHPPPPTKPPKPNKLKELLGTAPGDKPLPTGTPMPGDEDYGFSRNEDYGFLWMPPPSNDLSSGLLARFVRP